MEPILVILIVLVGILALGMLGLIWMVFRLQSRLAQPVSAPVPPSAQNVLAKEVSQPEVNLQAVAVVETAPEVEIKPEAPPKITPEAKLEPEAVSQAQPQLPVNEGPVLVASATQETSTLVLESTPLLKTTGGYFQSIVWQPQTQVAKPETMQIEAPLVRQVNQAQGLLQSTGVFFQTVAWEGIRQTKQASSPARELALVQGEDDGADDFFADVSWN